MATAGPPSPFADPSTYDAELASGLALTGEGKAYFIDGRLRRLKALLDDLRRAPRVIVDFGCGVGDGTARLAATFPEATVTGVEPEPQAIALARSRHAGRERVAFAGSLASLPEASVDLCFVNGVFHHIAEPERLAVLTSIKAALGPKGTLAFFENNPWNPGTRWVMHRLPFDRDAEPIDSRRGARHLADAGFKLLTAPRYLFFFPRALKSLRWLESRLERVPLGGQYLLLAGL